MGVAIGENNNTGNFNKDPMPEQSITNIGNINIITNKPYCFMKEASLIECKSKNQDKKNMEKTSHEIPALRGLDTNNSLKTSSCNSMNTSLLGSIIHNLQAVCLAGNCGDYAINP